MQIAQSRSYIAIIIIIVASAAIAAAVVEAAAVAFFLLPPNPIIPFAKTENFYVIYHGHLVWAAGAK